MGAVYQARQKGLQRDVAIKIIRRDLAGRADLVSRFENEINIISRLRHPNTIRVFDSGQAETGELFIVTELLRGASLAQELKKGALAFERAAAIITEVCGSLAEAHYHGVVHRDVKPDNIFLDQLGGETVAKLIDFGIAKVPEVKLTLPNVLVGSALYLSPEQVMQRPLDHRSDIYSLGVTLFEMLTGRVPFHSETITEVLRAHTADPAPRLSAARPDADFPAGTEELVEKMLEKRPSDRPGSVEEVRRALHEIDIDRTVRRRAVKLSAGPVPTMLVEPPTTSIAPTRVTIERPGRAKWIVLTAIGFAAVAWAGRDWFGPVRAPPPEAPPPAPPPIASPAIDAPPPAVAEPPAAPAPIAPPAIAPAVAIDAPPAKVLKVKRSQAGRRTSRKPPAVPAQALPPITPPPEPVLERSPAEPPPAPKSDRPLPVDFEE
jgi:eukaryotic-like serine/threonine-protein kinase